MAVSETDTVYADERGSDHTSEEITEMAAGFRLVGKTPWEPHHMKKDWPH